MRIEMMIARCPGFSPRRGRAALRVMLSCALLAFGAGNLRAQTNEAVTIDGHQAHPTRILAKFKSESGPVVHAGDMRQVGSKVFRRFKTLPNLAVLVEDNLPAIPASAAEPVRRARLLNRIVALKQTGLFDYVEPDYIVYPTASPSDAAFVDGRLWGLRNPAGNGADISAVDAWDITTGSTNVIVAVIDTGVRYTHQDLAGQMWHNPNEIPGNGIDDDNNGFIDDVYGINAVTGSGDPYDDTWDHGTHVSGTIGASANDNGPHVGVAWNVRIMALKFLDPFGYTADAITCIDYAVAKGARILNNSWGGGGYSQALYDAIDHARQADVLFVAAAGNDAHNNDTALSYPASYALDNIISVAALDRNDALADFSNYGLNTVDIGAPGVSIFSCLSYSDTDYGSMQGTSMAAPHVSGVAALVLSQYPGADVAKLRTSILSGAVPIPALAGKCVTGGRLNAYRSLSQIPSTGILHVSVNPPSGATLIASSNQTVFVTVTDIRAITNATVTASMPGVFTNLAFLNNGQTPDVRAGDSIYTASFHVPASPGAVTMTVAANATNEIGATNVIQYTIITLPPNDNFTNAIKVPAAGAVYSTDNRYATMEPLEPKHGGLVSAYASLWWNWTPTSNTNVFITTAGSKIDLGLGVYTGTSVGQLTQVAAAKDPGPSGSASLKLDATAGVTYRIAIASPNPALTGSLRLTIAPGGKPDTNAPVVAVTSPKSGLWVSNRFITIVGTASDNHSGASGLSQVSIKVNDAWSFVATGTTNWSCLVSLAPGLNSIKATAQDVAGNVSPPASLQLTYRVADLPNDLFAKATLLVLTNGAGAVSVSSTNATKEFGEPYHADNSGGKSVWWSYQPSTDGVLTLNTTNSTFDTLLALYTGSNVSSLTPIASNDDAYNGAPGGYSLIAQAVRANRTYSIAVDGYNRASGTIVLRYSFVPATVYRLATSNSMGGVVLVTSTNPSGGIVEMPGTAGDFAANTNVVLTAVPNAYYSFSTWSGSASSSGNPLTATMLSDLSFTGNFQPVAFTDGFESGNLSHLPWTTAGDVPWIVQTNTVAFGRYAARSGVIGNNQSSSLILRLTNFAAGDGSFDCRVSSEANFDTLKFYVNGLLVQQWSGEGEWANFSFPLDAGTNTLEWRYAKDYTLSSGLDAAFIDNLMLPLDTGESPSPARLALQRHTDGSFVVNLLGQANQQYVVQASTDLVNWRNISTNLAVNGVIVVPDPDSTTHPVRFYRAVAAP